MARFKLTARVNYNGRRANYQKLCIRSGVKKTLRVESETET